MKNYPTTGALILAISALSACGPQDWNNSAEYLPAPQRTEADLGSASIKDYILDVPPAKVFAEDQADLQRQLAAATPKTDGEGSSLTLEASPTVPRRDFLLSKRTNTLRMTVAANGNSPRKVSQFQRTSSDWNHWVED